MTSAMAEINPELRSRKAGMRVLWIANVPTDAASECTGAQKPVSGGWLSSGEIALAAEFDGDLAIAFPMEHSRNTASTNPTSGTRYFPFATQAVQSSTSRASHLGSIIDSYKPDIVHIHGTERAHVGLAVQLCRSKSVPVVISIQGVVSEVANHYIDGLPPRALAPSFRDIVRRDYLSRQRRLLYRQATIEREAICAAGRTIGRTDWDRARVAELAPTAAYYHCNESLRPSFLTTTWDPRTIEPYSITMSQGYYPIKGLHYMLQCLPEVLDDFPGAHLYVTGIDPIGTGLARAIRRTSYAKYLKSLIRDLGVDDSVTFTGPLDEIDMASRLARSNVYAMPSLIENSPNSLCEAMAIGVPSVATAVGGIPSLLEHGRHGYLCPADTPRALARSIKQIFSDYDVAARFSRQAREMAAVRHDPTANARRTIEIYEEILHESPNYDNLP